MFRVGLGFDAHRFEDGRPLYLGGIEFDHPMGLKGHSDADVLLHAVIDAILGACALGDIGELFPDSDSKFKDIRSTILLKEAVKRVSAAGWKIVNLDAVIICESPKILSKREQIRESLASMLNIGFDAVMIKGKTTEQLGFTGRKEGIAAQAVALLEKED